MHAGNHEMSFMKRDLVLSIYSGADVICLVFSPTFFFSHYAKSHIALQKGIFFFNFRKWDCFIQEGYLHLAFH